MTAMLKVSSTNRGSTESHAQFSNTFFQPLEPGRYEMDSICLPVAWYNITSSNNLITFYDTQARSCTLTPGIYTEDNLGAAIKTAMDAVADGGATFTVTFSDTTRAFTIAISAGTFYFTWGTSGTAYKLLGFSQTTGTAAASQVSDQMVDLANPRSVYIDIAPMASDVLDSKGYPGYLVPVTVNHGSVMYLTRLQLSGTLKLSTTEKTLRVTLRSDTGELIDMKSEWYFVLRRV